MCLQDNRFLCVTRSQWFQNYLLGVAEGRSLFSTRKSVLKKTATWRSSLTLLRACCEFYQNYGLENDFMSWVILVPEVTALGWETHVWEPSWTWVRLLVANAQGSACSIAVQLFLPRGLVLRENQRSEHHGAKYCPYWETVSVLLLFANSWLLLHE